MYFIKYLIVVLMCLVVLFDDVQGGPAPSSYSYTKRYGRQYNTYNNNNRVASASSNMAHRVKRGSKQASEMSRLIHRNAARKVNQEQKQKAKQKVHMRMRNSRRRNNISSSSSS